ncbi:AAA family ATPase [Clostridium sp. 001]|uniref:AAA family ATPase n=1 Tax=Clostridium sp. 001 TaxID=1970093 RepID=UPI0020B6C515|nr:AAA family ATPase [Clostridium sp. 001]
MIVKRISLGYSDFKRTIEDNYYFVDKTLFIKEVVEDGSAVILLPRPRRFGKSMNMSMLKCFFEKTEESNRELFRGLKIYSDKEIMKKQGQYPVIFITFKDVKDSSYDKTVEKIKDLIIEEYTKYIKLLDADILEKPEKAYFQRIIDREASEGEYELSLKNLSKFLSKYYNKRVFILVDEYDVPIQSGYLNNYYDKVIEFIRNLLSGALKDNSYLEKGILTGILRVAKESIFSGLNNINVCTILSSEYSEYFGFTEEEVEETLKYYGIEANMEELKNWYNGYIFGDRVIYNPWSVLNYVKRWKDGFKPYWTNTSSNDLVKTLVTKGGADLKRDLEELIKGNPIEKRINEDIVMGEIDKDTENVWSFLLFSGYLKVVKKRLDMGEMYCNLSIPNMEVNYLYRQIILGWFKESINNDKFNIMLKSLVTGDIETFEEIFGDYIIKSSSFFDISGDESEKIYHSFVLGMLVALNDKYEVKSNRESGYGRYDIMIIPRDKQKLGTIIEFKKVRKKETIEEAVDKALKQIQEKKYRVELEDMGIKNIQEIGIAFEGKKVLVKR